MIYKTPTSFRNALQTPIRTWCGLKIYPDTLGKWVGNCHLPSKVLYIFVRYYRKFYATYTDTVIVIAQPSWHQHHTPSGRDVALGLYGTWQAAIITKTPVLKVRQILDSRMKCEWDLSRRWI